MTKKPLVELKNVWKTYHMGNNLLHVLKGVSVQIYPGEFVAIVGPSGSGKSTLMNLVGVLDTPTKGSLLLNGVNVKLYKESQLAQIRGKTIGFVFQQFNLISTLTALENVTLPTIFQNMPKEERVKKAEELLTLVGLGDRMHHKPVELSGGQQQRVAISRALINDPDIILADEPTGNLDSASGKQIMSLLRELNTKKGKTVILVTHDTDLIKHSRKTILIKDGQIVSKL